MLGSRPHLGGNRVATQAEALLLVQSGYLDYEPDELLATGSLSSSTSPMIMPSGPRM